MDMDSAWPSKSQIDNIKGIVASMANANPRDVKIVLSPYRVCPLGAHIDHQGGSVTAMTINRGVILGFLPSGSPEVFLRSKQFGGEVKFSVEAVPSKIEATDSQTNEEGGWGNYARGAAAALQKKGCKISQGIVGFIDGSKGFHGAGVSSSAAFGIACLLSLEEANKLCISKIENITLDRLIENEYLGLRNGILDQSAILLSEKECLTVIHCKNQTYELIYPQKSMKYRIMLAFSGLRHALTSSTSYNLRVEECQEAARVLLRASGKGSDQPLLSNVTSEEYASHKFLLQGPPKKRATHFFTECARVSAGIKAWSHGNLEEFGRLMSDSGKSSIENYECGCQPMRQLLDIVLKAPGVFGARFSGAGFRGCCVALVDEYLAEKAVLYVQEKYREVQPELSENLQHEIGVAMCKSGDSAHVIDA